MSTDIYGGTTSGGTGTFSTSHIIWNSWTNSGANTSNTDSSTLTVWYDWCSTTTSSGTNDPFPVWVRLPQSSTRVYSPWDSIGLPNRKETEEEVRERLRRQEESRRRSEEYWAQRERERIAQETQLNEARIEATALLDSLLNATQKQCLKDEDWFLVIGKSGKIYRIRRGRVGNIDLVSPDGHVLATYCVHPGEHLPNADDLVAQKLHLEVDDEHLIQRANVHGRWDQGKGPVVDIRKHLRLAA